MAVNGGESGTFCRHSIGSPIAVSLWSTDKSDATVLDGSELTAMFAMGVLSEAEIKAVAEPDEPQAEGPDHPEASGEVAPPVASAADASPPEDRFIVRQRSSGKWVQDAFVGKSPVVTPSRKHQRIFSGKAAEAYWEAMGDDYEVVRIGRPGSIPPRPWSVDATGELVDATGTNVLWFRNDLVAIREYIAESVNWFPGGDLAAACDLMGRLCL